MKEFKFLLALLFFYSAPSLMAQQLIWAGKMTCRAQLISDSIDLHLMAPTQGWLAVGFNDENNIVHSDLIQLRIRNGQVEAQDQYVTGPGKHLADKDLGGLDNVEIHQGRENAEGTSVHFRIPFQSGDAYDFPHQGQQKFWIILAYSTHDDFQHHSIMRQHFEIQWE